MGARTIPESRAPIARPSGSLPSIGAGPGQALQRAGGQLQQLGAQLARADERITTARLRAQANAEALALRGQLLEATDRINTTADPINAEDQFIAEASQISQAFTDRGLPASVTENALADFNAFAQTQRFKVRTAARKRNIDLGRAATLAGVNLASQQFAEAESPIDQKAARRGYDRQLAIAEESRFFSAEQMEKMKQSTEIDLQTARVAHLINTGRARTALTQLNDGTIDLPPTEELVERNRVTQVIEKEHTNADATLRVEQDAAFNEFLNELAFAHLTDTPITISAGAIAHSNMRGNQREKIFKGFNNPTALFGSREKVSDVETIKELAVFVGRNVLTIDDVVERQDTLGVRDFVSYVQQATAITESGGVVSEFDASVGIEQIEAAHGVVKDQPLASVLNPEEILNLNRDVISYARQINDARRAGREIDEFALANNMAQRTMNNITIPKLQRRLANFNLPPANEWTMEVLDGIGSTTSVRANIENANMDEAERQRARDSLSRAIAIMQFRQGLQ